MNRKRLGWLLLFTLHSSLFTVSMLYAAEKEFVREYDYQKLLGQRPLQIYIEPVQNPGNIPDILILQKLEQDLKQVLTERKSRPLKIVNSGSEADAIITVRVLNFEWREHDPMDRPLTTVVAVADLLRDQNYAQLKALFSLARARDGQVVWQQVVRGVVTRSNMPKPDSFPLASRAAADMFVRRCFPPPS